MRKLNYYKKLLKIRQESPALIYGKFTPLPSPSENGYTYLRELNGERFLVILNLKAETITYEIPEDLKQAKVRSLLSNYKKVPDSLSQIKLRPYEAIVYRVGSL